MWLWCLYQICTLKCTCSSVAQVTGLCWLRPWHKEGSNPLHGNPSQPWGLKSRRQQSCSLSFLIYWRLSGRSNKMGKMTASLRATLIQTAPRRGHCKSPLQTFQEIWEWFLEAEAGKAQFDRPAERDVPGEMLNFPLQRELIVGHKASPQARCLCACQIFWRRSACCWGPNGFESPTSRDSFQKWQILCIM